MFDLSVAESPYIDYELLRGIYRQSPRPEAVTRCFCGLMDNHLVRTLKCYGLPHKAAEDLNLSNTHCQTFGEIRRLASYNLVMKVAPSYASAFELMEKSGLNHTLYGHIKASIYKTTKPEKVELPDGVTRWSVSDKIRPFSSPYTVIMPIAKTVFADSANAMIFGAPGIVVLPGRYVHYADQIQKLTAAKKNAIIKEAEILRDKAVEKYRQDIKSTLNDTDFSDFGQFRSIPNIMRERLTDISWDISRYSSRRNVFFDNTFGPDKLRVAMRFLFSGITTELSEEEQAGANDYEPRLEMVMFWTIATQIDPEITFKSLDYFIANDYIQIDGGASKMGKSKPMTTVLRGNNKDGYDEITDIDTLRILSYLISLDSDDRVELASKLF